MWWVIHMCRGFDPLFSLWQDRARSFWGVFSHPSTQKRSFEYKSSQNLIFLAPKYHFSLDLFGSNFQWPAAHPQQFSDRVPPPPRGHQSFNILRPWQTGYHFAEHTFKSILLRENVCILVEISVNLALWGPVYNKLPLVQVTAWHWTDDKPLSEMLKTEISDIIWPFHATMS